MTVALLVCGDLLDLEEQVDDVDVQLDARKRALRASLLEDEGRPLAPKTTGLGVQLSLQAIVGECNRHLREHLGPAAISRP